MSGNFVGKPTSHGQKPNLPYGWYKADSKSCLNMRILKVRATQIIMLWKGTFVAGQQLSWFIYILKYTQEWMCKALIRIGIYTRNQWFIKLFFERAISPKCNENITVHMSQPFFCSWLVYFQNIFWGQSDPQINTWAWWWMSLTKYFFLPKHPKNNSRLSTLA